MASLLDKVRQVGVLAKEVKARAVLDGGDFFHVKSPTRNTHRLVHQAIEAHREYSCPVYGNIGNHDCKYGDYAFLDEQPLGVLFESGVFKRLYDKHEALFEEVTDYEIHGIQTTGLVRVVGVPYHGTAYDMERLKSIKKGKEDFLVVVAHLLASPKGGTMFEGEDIVRYSDLADLAPDVWCFGHWHKNQGVTEIAPGKWVVNIGSMSRGSLGQDDLSRTPSVAVLEFDRGRPVRITERPLDVKPAVDVFDLDGRLRSQARDFSVEVFVDSIRSTLAEASQKDIPDVIRELPDVPEAVREASLVYWENAG